MPAHAIRAPFARTVRLGRLDDHRLAALAGTGDERAFEALYERHHRALLGFCRHLLHSREEGEDALQQTFLRAHRSLVQHGPPEDVRPWLFAIARNRCRTIAASRRSAEVPDDELEPATEGLGPEVQRRDDLRALLADLGRLPEDQRAALVLGELGDLSHAEIGTVIGVPAAKVKALVFQARSRLIADREARDTSCADIRMQLATARGGELRRGPLRRHLKECAPCRKYRSAISEQRAALALLLPVLPTAGLKATVLGAAGGGAGGGAAAAVGTGAGAATGGFSGGSFGLTGIGAKLAVGATLVGGAGGGAILVEQSSHGERAEGAAAVVAAPGLAAPPERAEAVTVADSAGGAGEERGTAGARGRERAAEARERAQRRRAAAERKRAKEKAAKRAERRRKAKKQKRAKAAPPAYGRTAQPAKPLTPGADRPATQPSAPRAVDPAARQAPVVRLPRPAKLPVVLPDPPVGPAKAFAPAKAPKAKLAP